MGCMCARMRDKLPDPPVDSEPKQKTASAKVSKGSKQATEKQEAPLSLSSTRVRVIAQEFTSDYQIIKKLAESPLLQVLQAKHVSTKQLCYIKAYPKSEKDSLRIARRKFGEEVAILSRLDHPNIARVLEAVEDPEFFVVVFEELTEITLMDALPNFSPMTEEIAATIIQQVLQALNYAHGMGVIHSNLTFSSIVFKSKPQPDDIVVKVCDFNSAILTTKGKKAKTQLSVFTAPEQAEGASSEKIDVWSCGIILYMIFSSTPPFPINLYVKKIKKNKKKQAVPFPSDTWGSCSSELKSILAGMLDWNPQSRFSASNCLQHPWIKSKTNPATATTKEARFALKNMMQVKSTGTLEFAIKMFILYRVVQSGGMAEYVQAFKAIDVNGDGLISVPELKLILQKLMPQAEAEAEARRIMQTVDKNENSHLDYTEFLLAALGEKQLISTRNLSMVFNSLDRDNSGKVSVRELKNAFFLEGGSEKEHLWQSLIRLGDASGDGELDYKEFKKMMMHGVSHK